MKTWIKKVFGFGLASFFGDFSHEMTISLVPILVTQFVGAAQAPFYLGLIASLTGAFASLLRIFSGILTDRIPRKKPLIAFGYGIAALFSTLVGFAHSVGAVLLYRIIAFTGSGLREPPRDALIAATIEPINYGRAFGLRNGMDTLGALVGPLVALACANIFSVRAIFALSFIPGILAVVAIMLFTEDIKIAPIISKTSWKFWEDLFKLPSSFIFFSSILFVLQLGNFDKLLLFARTQEIINVPKEHIAWLLIFLYALFNFVRACGEFIIGLLSDYINRITLLAIFGCGSFIGTTVLLITPHASLFHCICIFILSGISTAAIFTLKKACAADMLPADVRGLGYGTMEAIEGFAILISNLFIGFLWTQYSPLLGFSFSIIMNVIALFLLIYFRSIQSGK